jgi:hypothetical protein
LLPAGRLAFAGRASNPLDRDERFQLVLTIIPLSCSPDATTLRRFHMIGTRSKGLSRTHKRRIDQMLDQEPRLQLIGSDHVGDDEIVCSVIS